FQRRMRPVKFARGRPKEGISSARFEFDAHDLGLVRVDRERRGLRAADRDPFELVSPSVVLAVIPNAIVVAEVDQDRGIAGRGDGFLGMRWRIAFPVPKILDEGVERSGKKALLEYHAGNG